MPLEENINRIVLEEGTVEARTIEDAIAALGYHVVLDEDDFCFKSVVTYLNSFQ